MMKLPQFIYIPFQETFMKGEQAGKKKVKTCTQKDTSQYSMRTAMETRIGSC